MTANHADGLLSLGLRCDPQNRTVLARRRQRFPLRMTVPLYLDPADPGMAFLYVQNPTGGVFAGDALAIQVTAEAHSRAHLTTQSATKLYRMDGGSALQDFEFSVAEGAYLEYLPDPLIPQAGADLLQRTVVELAPGASFLAAETVAPGRRARGERFAYERIRLRTAIRRGSRELCVDALDLCPDRSPPGRRGLLSTGDYLASLLIGAPEHDPDRLAARLDAALAGEPDVLAAAGALPNRAGAVVRIVGDRAPAVRRVLFAAWRVAREHVLGLHLPPVRK